VIERLTQKVSKKAEFGRLLYAQRQHARFIEGRLESGWGTYKGLAPTSTALAALEIGSESPRRVSILVPSVAPGAVFAGIRTALAAACVMADRLGLPLRVVTFGGPLKSAEAAVIDQMMRSELGYEGPQVVFAWVWATTALRASPDEVWVATHWGTAHALDVAGKVGLIDPGRVVYLVQDHEPSFYASSSDSALAQSTYHAGFRLVVNSSPLAEALARRENLVIESSAVFRPELDETRLEEVAAAGRPSGPLVVGFYARPQKPRNAYAIGIAALKVAARRLEESGTEVVFRSMGDLHPPVRLTPRTTLQSLGKLPWAGYFEELARTDVLLSLQMSPHPSHPPLDAVVGGGWAVTNDVDGSRATLSPRLLAVLADPGSLADAIVRAVGSARDDERVFDDGLLASLGAPLATVMTKVADDVR